MNKLYKPLLFALIAAVTSCKQFVEVDPPKTQLIKTVVFSNESTVMAAMSNVYLSCAGNSFASGGANGITRLAGMSADELDTYSTGKDTKQIYQNAILPENAVARTIWEGGYNVIYQCNAIIEGLEQSKGISEALKQQIIGEALFMRAFSHFCLLNIYGDIPYITTINYQENTVAKRIAYKSVLDFIINDLKNAKLMLSANYPSVSLERIKPNKWAACSLLARAYLYQEDWTNAEFEANDILGQTSIYGLTSLNSVFIKNSKESIWQLKPVSNNAFNTYEGSAFILTAKPTSVYLKEGFVTSFELGDQRKAAWVGSFSNASGTWYFPYKYKIKTGVVPFNEYSMVLRLAEQYFIRAEARAKQNKLKIAIDDLDEIRFRAGLSKIGLTNPNISKEDFLLLIEQERKVELFSEWGHRWFDLKRTGRIDEVLGATKPGWISTAALYPIPASECLVNINMVQNLGYPK